MKVGRDEILECRAAREAHCFKEPLAVVGHRAGVKIDVLVNRRPYFLEGQRHPANEPSPAPHGPDINSRRLLVLIAEQPEIGIARIECPLHQLPQALLVQHQESDEAFRDGRGGIEVFAPRDGPERIGVMRHNAMHNLGTGQTRQVDARAADRRVEIPAHRRENHDIAREFLDVLGGQWVFGWKLAYR